MPEKTAIIRLVKHTNSIWAIIPVLKGAQNNESFATKAVAGGSIASVNIVQGLMKGLYMNANNKVIIIAAAFISKVPQPIMKMMVPR